MSSTNLKESERKALSTTSSSLEILFNARDPWDRASGAQLVYSTVYNTVFVLPVLMLFHVLSIFKGYANIGLWRHGSVVYGTMVDDCAYGCALCACDGAWCACDGVRCACDGCAVCVRWVCGVRVMVCDVRAMGVRCACGGACA